MYFFLEILSFSRLKLILNTISLLVPPDIGNQNQIKSYYQKKKIFVKIQFNQLSLTRNEK